MAQIRGAAQAKASNEQGSDVVWFELPTVDDRPIARRVKFQPQPLFCQACNDQLTIVACTIKRELFVLETLSIPLLLLHNLVLAWVYFLCNQCSWMLDQSFFDIRHPSSAAACGQHHSSFGARLCGLNPPIS